MDEATIRNLFSGPNQDTRQWVSNATVDISTPDAPSVRFKDENGKMLTTGPLVAVTLQPSGISIQCRVANFCAGNGEGEWYPFVDKDEVLVALAAGSEQSGGVIIGRLNQEIDAFPERVGGLDATENKFGFQRMRAPFIIETAASFLIRSAVTGSQIGIDPQGQVVINDASKNKIFFSPDVIDISTGDATVFVQLHVEDKRLAMQAGDATFALAKDTVMNVPGKLNIGTSGASGNGHAVTMEQVILMICNFWAYIATTQSLTPTYGVTYALGFAPILNGIVAAIAAGASPTPLGITPGGNIAVISGSMAAVNAGLANPLPQSDPTGLLPGIGRGGFLL